MPYVSKSTSGLLSTCVMQHELLLLILLAITVVSDASDVWRDHEYCLIRAALEKYPDALSLHDPTVRVKVKVDLVCQGFSGMSSCCFG